MCFRNSRTWGNREARFPASIMEKNAQSPSPGLLRYCRFRGSRVLPRVPKTYCPPSVRVQSRLIMSGVISLIGEGEGTAVETGTTSILPLPKEELGHSMIPSTSISTSCVVAFFSPSKFDVPQTSSSPSSSSPSNLVLLLSPLPFPFPPPHARDSFSELPPPSIHSLPPRGCAL